MRLLLDNILHGWKVQVGGSGRGLIGWAEKAGGHGQMKKHRREQIDTVQVDPEKVEVKNHLFLRNEMDVAPWCYKWTDRWTGLGWISAGGV